MHLLATGYSLLVVVGGELPFAAGAKSDKSPEESGRSGRKIVCDLIQNAAKTGDEFTP
jgi:hypothetical protein